jgi:hypothetical protein
MDEESREVRIYPAPATQAFSHQHLPRFDREKLQLGRASSLRLDPPGLLEHLEEWKGQTELDFLREACPIDSE